MQQEKTKNVQNDNANKRVLQQEKTKNVHNDNANKRVFNINLFTLNFFDIVFGYFPYFFQSKYLNPFGIGYINVTGM